MNLSGRSVRAIRDFYKMELEHILIVSDDFQLELGKLRFRATGSAGGQNGLAHVLQQLGTLDVPRLRVGIGPVPENWSTVDFVLGKYSKDERPVADEAIARAACGVEAWVAQGLATAMNRYN
jgi:PTH1 family peptidyl-tRNA hydrolase